MMRLASLLAFVALLPLGPAAAQTATGGEEAAVRAALEHYLAGHATGDGKHHSMVFHPESKLFFNSDGKFATRTSAEYIAGSSGKPAADESRRKRRITMDENRHAFFARGISHAILLCAHTPKDHGVYEFQMAWIETKREMHFLPGQCFPIATVAEMIFHIAPMRIHGRISIRKFTENSAGVFTHDICQDI